jgi:hypothetical protein
MAIRTFPVGHGDEPGYKEIPDTRKYRDGCMSVIKTVHDMRNADRSEAEIDSAVCNLDLGGGNNKGIGKALEEIRKKCKDHKH